MSVKRDIAALMNQVISFSSGMESVRVAMIDGEPWFVARDVCGVLGYSNASKATSDHCKGVTKRYAPTTSGVQELAFIPERDVYRLLMRSKPCT